MVLNILYLFLCRSSSWHWGAKNQWKGWWTIYKNNLEVRRNSCLTGNRYSEKSHTSEVFGSSHTLPHRSSIIILPAGNSLPITLPGNSCSLLVLPPGNNLLVLPPGNSLLVLPPGNSLLVLFPGNNLLALATGSIQLSSPGLTHTSYLNSRAQEMLQQHYTSVHPLLSLQKSHLRPCHQTLSIFVCATLHLSKLLFCTTSLSIHCLLITINQYYSCTHNGNVYLLCWCMKYKATYVSAHASKLWG